jgi:hypothetical protein
MWWLTTHEGDEKCVHKSGNIKDRDHLHDLVVYRRIILKEILKN